MEAQTINLIELCDEDPIAANDIVRNTSKYPMVLKSHIEAVPWSIMLKNGISTKYLNKLVSTYGSIIKAYPVMFQNIINKQTCLECNDTHEKFEKSAQKKTKSAMCIACGSTNVKIQKHFGEAATTQILKIQDVTNSKSLSETIELHVSGDLAGKFVPGDRVYAIGVVSLKWKPLKINEPIQTSLVVNVLSLIKEKEDLTEHLNERLRLEELNTMKWFEKRKMILESFGENLIGLTNVKLGILLALCSGKKISRHPEIALETAKRRKENGGLKKRQNIHILMIGDPGTGKTHLLHESLGLVSPSIMTNGLSTSDAGLTSCAVRQGKDWILEAGALVLADSGICCIDEFDRLKYNEKSGLLESMEQQTISIAKAGILTTMNTRCSIIGSMGMHDRSNIKSVAKKFNMSSALVSRFDLIFMMPRVSEKNEDPRSEKLLSRTPYNGSVGEKDIVDEYGKIKKLNRSILRCYIRNCKNIDVATQEHIGIPLIRYYTEKRKIEGHNELNTSRFLESLVRIAEAHAKLLDKTETDIVDVSSAIMLMETTIGTGNIVKINPERIFLDYEYFMEKQKEIESRYGDKENCTV